MTVSTVPPEDRLKDVRPQVRPVRVPPPLSVQAAKSIPVRQVVAALGLKRAPGRNKYVCPRHCGGSLHLFPKNAYCFGGCRVLDNIDLVRAALGLSFSAALQWLGVQFPEAADGLLTMTAPPLRDRVDPDMRSRILTALDANLCLTPTGRAYMAGRGFDPDHAEMVGGFKSIDADQWDEVRVFLRRDYSERQLASAGVRGLGWFTAKASWPEPVDALVLPYRSIDGRLLTIRLRRISEGEGSKYRALVGGGTASEPFASDWVYGHCVGCRVHITEGELDAWTLIAEYRELALGAPGAWAVRPEWFEALRGCSEIVLWGDGDQAGQQFVATARRAIAATLGDLWVAMHRIGIPTLAAGRDVNDLHLAGELADVLREVSA